ACGLEILPLNARARDGHRLHVFYLLLCLCGHSCARCDGTQHECASYSARDFTVTGHLGSSCRRSVDRRKFVVRTPAVAAYPKCFSSVPAGDRRPELGGGDTKEVNATKEGVWPKNNTCPRALLPGRLTLPRDEQQARTDNRWVRAGDQWPQRWAVVVSPHRGCRKVRSSNR